MKSIRALISAAVLFVGAAGSMGTLGVLIFEETVALTVYSVGVAAGASWLALGTYRAELAENATRPRTAEIDPRAE
ncbi:hypothetical protein GCM10007036_06030 [Alsobacter metallidurans]|uniref:Uncharacterized protein n=1 Tax=Alsobacter metallidurans TaxID=340221 RepID=A0A917MFN6_9HYPH|nr:hypothetical protein [Alsobacter metallidurans]GGH09807.1 hypothetical protein GCM10007036_06030 [Alsobacter metallidurans]